MVGSRLERFGHVYSRVRDLIRSGVINIKDRPLWFDVYEKFPPKRVPFYEKPHTRRSFKPDTVPEIFYKEDEIRAKFYKHYWVGPLAMDLFKSNYVSLSQRFVDKYTELKKDSDLDDSALFEETAKSLLMEGIILKRIEGYVPAKSRDALLKLKISEMLAEQQSVGADSKETRATERSADLDSSKAI